MAKDYKIYRLSGDTIDTVFARNAGLATVRLNRPHALNALAPGQFSAIHSQLAAWAADDRVGAILLEGEGERAFCAGGDIRAVWDACARGDHAFNRRLFWDEYRLDRLIHHYPKPIISFLDGIVMGGGAGIAVNGRYRIVTERSLFAMPEAAIGFFPDVGATHFLSRCPGAIGLYLGLTGARLAASDMMWAGLATHFVPSQGLAALKDRLARVALSPAAVAAELDAAQGNPGQSMLSAHAEAIEYCFGRNSIEAVRAALADDPGAWAEAARAGMKASSPTSLAVIFRQLTEGRGLDFDTAIRREYDLACRFLAGRDFYEGIRAVLVDKDKAPQWQNSIADVAEYFAPQGEVLSFED